MGGTDRPGDAVKWKWGPGDAEATVEEVHTERVECTIKGGSRPRNGTEDEPAYVLSSRTTAPGCARPTNGTSAAG